MNVEQWKAACNIEKTVCLMNLENVVSLSK